MSLCFHAVPDVIIVGYICHYVLASTMVVCVVVTMSLCFRSVPDVIIVGYLCHHVLASTVVVCVVVTMSLCFCAVPDVIIVGYLCHHVLASTMVVSDVATMSLCFRAVPDPGPNPSKPMSDPGSLFLNLIKSSDARPLIQNIIMNVNYNNADKTSGDDEHAQQWH